MSEDLTPEIMLDSILEQDKRYSRLAYCFMMDALNYTTTRMPVRRHITGQELSMGIRNYAIQQFGIAARLVFEQWGITENTTDVSYASSYYYSMSLQRGPLS